jgi:6-phosphofructokinase 1
MTRHYSHETSATSTYLAILGGALVATAVSVLMHHQSKKSSNDKDHGKKPRSLASAAKYSSQQLLEYPVMLYQSCYDLLSGSSRGNRSNMTSSKNLLEKIDEEDDDDYSSVRTTSQRDSLATVDAFITGVDSTTSFRLSSSGRGIYSTTLSFMDVPKLSELLPSFNMNVPNNRLNAFHRETVDGYPYLNYVSGDDIILGDIIHSTSNGKHGVSRGYKRAGPVKNLYFSPSNVKAAIVTCGGLCPGLNNVIRELVNTLSFSYGVKEIYGIRHGFWGFHVDVRDPSRSTIESNTIIDPTMLTPAVVEDIAGFGGTILGSDRGGFDAKIIFEFCVKRGINQVYIIGGDGTHRGADLLYKHVVEHAKFPISVVGIPKTIDNDVAIIDKSFGFDTSFSEAQIAIRSAYIEASAAENGIGIVKLMGRYAGYIAAHASLASGVADLCLIPEVPVILEGNDGILQHIELVLSKKKHAVIIVAEGAGENLLQATGEVDAGGNKKLPQIGQFLLGKINQYLLSKNVHATIKYIDPSYMIRSVKANPSDSIYCSLLAQNAVHAGMAGYTGCTVGLVNNRSVFIPISEITANSPRKLNPRGRTYERILMMTKQPDPLASSASSTEFDGGTD